MPKKDTPPEDAPTIYERASRIIASPEKHDADTRELISNMLNHVRQIAALIERAEQGKEIAMRLNGQLYFVVHPDDPEGSELSASDWDGWTGFLKEVEGSSAP